MSVVNHTMTEAAATAQFEMMKRLAQNASCRGGSSVGRMTVCGILSAMDAGRGCNIWVASSVSKGRNALYRLLFVWDRKGWKGIGGSSSSSSSISGDSLASDSGGSSSMVLSSEMSTSLAFPLLLRRLLSDDVRVLLSSRWPNLLWFWPSVLSTMPSSSSSELSDIPLGPPKCCLDLCSA